jgi:hypothetical protein
LDAGAATGQALAAQTCGSATAPIKPRATCNRSHPMALYAIAAVVIIFGLLNFLDFKRFD